MLGRASEGINEGSAAPFLLPGSSASGESLHSHVQGKGISSKEEGTAEGAAPVVSGSL